MTSTSQPPLFDVLLAGMYFCDIIFTGLPQMPEPGKEIVGTGFDIVPGGNFNTAIALHRLGVRVGWSCDFGNDFLSQFVLSAARQHGLNETLFRQHDRALRNATVSLSFANDRAFVTYVDPFEPVPLLAVVRQFLPRCLILPGLYLHPELPEVCALVRERGGIVYMDCQQTDATLQLAEVREALTQVDVFAPNATEALQLTGAASIEQALARLAELTPIVIIKLGREGAIAQRGNQVMRGEPYEAKVLDTTGAGDCFNAGFVFGYLRGENLETCVRYGNIVGAISTTAYGFTGTPTASQLETVFSSTQAINRKV